MTKYEFTIEQNSQIMDLARFMRYTGILAVVFGLLAIISSVITEIVWVNVLFFGFLVVAGITFYLPTDNFIKIVKTEGNDIEELMKGFKELYYGWIVVIGILLLLLILEFF